MRDLFVLPIFLGLLGLAFAAPYVGVLTWAWITLMHPHRSLWGVLSGLPLNLIVAIVATIAWVMSREPKRIPMNALIVTLIIFIGIMTISTAFSLVPKKSWPLWDRNLKTIAITFFIASLANTRVRVHAMVWVAAISVGYYGAKGGFFTLRTGGEYRTVGPYLSPIGENNPLALALCMVLPLLNYLRLQSRVRWIRIGLIVALSLTVIGILGTHSRGGLIGLAVVSMYFWWKSDGKIFTGILGSIVLIGGISFMPGVWEDRMSTISDPLADNSFRVRIQAWTFAINVALERPLLGGGFSAGELLEIYQQYLPDHAGLTKGRSSHSIYFQVLADHGFPGFIVYVTILAMAWWTIFNIKRQTDDIPELLWMNQLVRMMQASLLAYGVAGLAQNMAYYDLLYIQLGLIVAMRNMLTEYLRAVEPMHMVRPMLLGKLRDRTAAIRGRETPRARG